LFFAKAPQRPSFRFRVEQMLPAFAARGHACQIVFESDGWVACAQELLSGRYDVVFVQKQTLPSPLLALLRARVRTLVYDVDDAIMFDLAGRLERTRSARFGEMARAAERVMCGNQVLAREVEALGGKPVIVPTSIDTERFHPREREARAAMRPARTVIGWTGSRTNNAFLSDLFPVLARLGDSIELRILSCCETGFEYARLGRVQYTFTKWTPDNEVGEVARFDIGVMPLPDSAWTRGKCGLKALQYMALGVPALASPVGANCEVIADGETGFLPNGDDAWHEALARLVVEPALRARIGAAGRARTEASYSLAAVGPRLVAAVEGAAEGV